MSLIINKNIENGFFNKNSDNIKQDFFGTFHDELIVEIFSFLNLGTLGTICFVSREWKRLANEPTLWKMAIYRELAFGNDKWEKCFGKDSIGNEDSKEELSSLPLNDFISDCKKFKSLFPEKNMKDALMLVRVPKTLNGQLTLKSLYKLAKNYFLEIDWGYRFIWRSVVDGLGDKSIDESHWVLMTKDVLPGSRNKTYAQQQDIVDKLAQKGLVGYEIPETLEAAVCIFSHYYNLSTRLFSIEPLTYGRCKDEINGVQTIVGFDSKGLYVITSNYVNEYFGVAALRKF